MIKIVIHIFAFLALSAVCFATPAKPNKMESARELLKHADTYYWLSRARDNDLVDVRKTLLYAKRARKLLKGLEETSEVRQLKYQAATAISEAGTQLSDASELLGNFSPLFSMLTGHESVIEMYDDADDIAIERSVVSILKIIKKPAKISQLFILIVAEGANSMAEEVARGYINSHTSYYAAPRYELSAFLTRAEVNSLNHDPIPKKVIKKTCDRFSVENIGVLRLFKKDEIDGIFYWGAAYNYWNSATGKKSYHCYADGFCESPSPYSSLLLLLILMGFPVTLLFNYYNNMPKKSSERLPPVWLASIAALFSLIVVGMAFRGISMMDIDGGTLIMSPLGIWWIAAFTLILGLLPLLLVYIGASKVNRASNILNNPETISSLVFGAYLGSFTFLAYTAAVRMGCMQPLLIAIPAIMVSGIVALRVGIAYSRHAIANDKMSGIEYILLLIGLIIYMLFVLIWDFRLLLAASAGCLIFSVIAALVPTSTVKLKGKLVGKAEKADDGGEVTGLAWLRHTIKEPEFFCKPWEEEFEKVQKWVTGNDDPQIEVVFIEAHIGCGKTRTAKEIAGQIEKQYKENQFRTKTLFGDCDEFSQDADVVPYEPFSQALSDLLGVGRFANPTEKAEKLKVGLESLGLRTVISAAGMGALETLLDARDEKQAVKTNAKEMANVVAEALTDLSKKMDGKKGKVVFIIDDVQWMDAETFELLKLLFDALDEFKDNQVSFIFTQRPDSPHGHNKVKDLITKELQKNGVINVNDDINQGLLDNEGVVEGILENLRFEFKTKQSFTGHFRGVGIQRPLHILQAIETAIDMGMLEAFADRYVLSKDANLKKLPPPDDFKRLVEEILSGLDPRIISILQCCAVIGRYFRFSIVADIFSIDRLELLRLFKEPEERNIIRDVIEEDDIYEFVEKRTVGIFRGLKWTPREGDSISQQVREYHKRFISLKEREIGIDKDKSAINSATYRDIISLASHSNAVRDVYPDKTVDYNRLAAERTYSRGMFSTAVNYYNNSIEIIEKDQAKVAPEKMLDLYISYAKCLLDEQSDSGKVAEFAGKAFKILESSGLDKDFDKDWAEIEIRLIEALNHYRSGQSEDASRKSDEIMKNDKATVIQKARANFYHTASLPPEEKEKCKAAHLQIIDETTSILEDTSLSKADKIEILKVKSEAANNTGFVFLSGVRNLVEAIRHFKMAIEINQSSEINDQKGIGIAHGGLGDCYKEQGELNNAKKAYEINLEISERAGDKQGICRMTSMLGAIKIEEAKKSEGDQSALFKEAKKLYEKSLANAEDQNHIGNICFALSGILERIVASEAYGEADYVFKKLEDIRRKYDLSEAPDFALDALKVSLEGISAANTECSDLFKRTIDILSKTANDKKNTENS